MEGPVQAWGAMKDVAEHSRRKLYGLGKFHAESRTMGLAWQPPTDFDEEKSQVEGEASCWKNEAGDLEQKKMVAEAAALASSAHDQVAEVVLVSCAEVEETGDYQEVGRVLAVKVALRSG